MSKSEKEEVCNRQQFNRSSESCCIITAACDAPDCRFKTPGIAKGFEIFGWIFTFAGVIMLIVSLINRDMLLIIPASSVFIGGMAYLAVAAIVRAVVETAWNTRELVKLKEQELDEKSL